MESGWKGKEYFKKYGKDTENPQFKGRNDER